jgi:hypothetical protein
VFGPKAPGRYQYEKFYYVPGPPEWTEACRFVTQLTVQITQSELDIAANLLNIISSLVVIIFTILQMRKKKKGIKEPPFVIISERENHKEIVIKGYEQEEAEKLAEKLAPMVYDKSSTVTDRKITMQGQFAKSSRFPRRRKGKREK